MTASIITLIVVIVIVIVVASVVAAIIEDHKWSAVKAILKEPIGSGEFAVTGDAPDAVFDGRRYAATFFKDLHKDPMRGYRFSFWFVHDEDDFKKIEFGPGDIDASGLTDLEYIKKVVYKL